MKNLTLKFAPYTIEEEVMYKSNEKTDFQKPIAMRKTWKLFGITIKRVISNQIFKADYIQANRIYEGSKTIEKIDINDKKLSKIIEEYSHPDLKPNHESIMRPTCEGNTASCSDLV